MNYQIIIFLAIFSSITLGWSYMMLRIVIGLFPVLSRYTSPLMIIGLVWVLAFIIGLVWANSTPNILSTTLYKYGSIWLGSITISGLIAIFLLALSRLTGITYHHIWYLIGFIIIALWVNIWALYASFVPKVVEYTVDIQTPHTWHGKKIIMIADTHYGNIYDADDARKLVEKINTLSGEVVIIPGDFFDGPIIDFWWIAREFEKITAPYGVIFANGNHEEYRNTDSMLMALEKSKITILNNKKIILDGMNFAWVTYHDTETNTGLRDELDGLDLQNGSPTILLKHKPTLMPTLMQYPIDLVVSGHTHRGQMWPFTYITDIIYGKYAYGMSVDNMLTSITTSGVWSWWPPQRLGTRSEIVVIEVR